MARVGGEVTCSVIGGMSQVIVHRHGTRFPTKPSGAWDHWVRIVPAVNIYDHKCII